MTDSTTAPTVTVRAYRFDVSKPADAHGWARLQSECIELGLKHVDVIMPNGREWMNRMAELDGQALAIDTSHLFGDQYNTLPIDDGHGLRVHDWHTAIFPNRNIKRGYYLELSPELEAAKDARHVCGYCGAQYDNPTHAFCTRCAGSEHLKPDELHLLLLLPVRESFGADRKAIIGEAPAALREAYDSAQVEAEAARAKAVIERETAKAHRLVSEAQAKVQLAEEERDFRLWAISQGLGHTLGNVIFYTHTLRYAVGWRTPLDRATWSAWADALTESPYSGQVNLIKAGE